MNPRTLHYIFSISLSIKYLQLQIPNKIAISTSAPQSPVELHPIVVLSTDCSICYNQFASYSLRDEVAVIKCSNEKCSNVFHAPCAREWLVSLSSSKIMFGTLYGACPYCGSELQVPVI